jgi:putative ABC transport system permease protein
VQILEGFHLALQQIFAEKLKSFFSVLGVIIGVMFLLVVVSVVEGIDRYMREDVASEIFGVNTVVLRRWPAIIIDESPEARRERLRHPRISHADAKALEAAITIPSLVVVESQVGGMQVVADNGRTATNVRIVGSTADVFTVRDWQVASGRAFSPQEAEAGTAVVVLGSQVADILFSSLDPVGRDVRIGSFPYRVIGVLEEQGSLFGESLDGLAIAPARSPVEAVLAPRGYVDSVILQALDPLRLRELKEEAEGIMRTRRHLRPAEPNDFALDTAEDSLSFWDNISRILFLALPGLVAISLVVGGIVIMNIMLVSVMERTREIGVRKAVGARRRDILTQIVIESTTLSVFGALVGVGIGVILAGLVSALSPLPSAVAPRWIALGIVLGVSVGIASGVYPAARAAKLDPVDALRYE